MPTESTVDIGLLLPEVLGTYGDSGNAEVLLRRLAWRGIRARIVTVHMGEPIPRSLDLYVLGGERTPRRNSPRTTWPPGRGWPVPRTTAR